MENTLFVLGAHDPEMKKIEELLYILGYSFSYALEGDTRTNVTNAYESEYFNFFQNNIIYIECSSLYLSESSLSIDHHRLGDYGYDLDHNHFVEASSLGQFFKYVLENDFHYASTVLGLEITHRKDSLNPHMYFDNFWFLDTVNGTIKIPEEIVLISGIDHCLIDAYKGKCKGIDTDNLLEIRINQISKDLSVSTTSLLSLVEEYSNKLKYFGKIIDFTDDKIGEGIYSPEYLILRELAISKNVPIAVKIVFNNLEKIMFLSLEKNEVENLLETKTYKNINLEKMFGVPNRGYAGGFIKKVS